MNKKVYELTQSGIDKLKEELDYLKNVKRNENLQALREAREQGDLSENADYSAARDEQASIESRILEIQNILKNAKIIISSNANKEINIGKIVHLKFLDTLQEKTLHLVGILETDPFMDKISIESPLGKSLKGHKAGEKIIFKTETGKNLEVYISKVQ